MVSDSATDSLIRWSDGGDSFFVLDHERVAHDVLPRWFKHNNFASFVRQLNMYGFHKIPHLQQGVLKSETETEIWNFEHPNFHRGQPDLLCLITRKKQAPERQTDDVQGGDKDAAAGFPPAGLNAGSLVDINSIINGITAIKRHQATISADLNDLKSSNQHLWQEALDARERHKKQQDTINRILKFLAGVFGNSTTPRKGSPANSSPQTIPRKRQRLMIEGAQQSLKQDVLEPLDGEDLVDDIPVDDIMPGNRIVELSPSPIPPKTEAQTASESIPPLNQPSNLADVVMGGNFTAPSPFAPFSNVMPNSDSSMFAPPFSHTEDRSPKNALTATSQGGPNQDVLQAIANSPGQLQRLLQLISFQQHNVPMPPPLDLNAPHSDTTHYQDDFIEPQPPLQHQQSSSTPLTMSDNFNLVEPDQQTLSLLHADDLSPITFEPLLTNEDQLHKSHRDAADISEDIDAIQTSLDSLINNLGFDPLQVSGMHDAELGAQSDINSLYTEPETNTDHSQPPHSSDSGPSPFASELTDKNGTVDVGGIKFQNTIPEFDFNAFINELSRQHPDGETDASGFNDLRVDELDPFIKAGSDTSTSPQVSAFVDEVASQSDASSPPLTRASVVEDPVPDADAPAPPSETAKKARKRKSDVEPVTSQRMQVKAKRKR
ncbi:hypothetical protein EW145_g6623 [Phellinidium pouzarii]|uniref:HSF-type DNA-binding domain-containing protein n=1 Tax=Phellinidium pouzarii TaxID=167371 RepID=A0A4S4KW56_9AGAM|nr:hypothetical protein EW145_g6623 [Phellinidium pouzarii]